MLPASDDKLRALVPLNVVLLTESPTAEHANMRTAISRAFKGGSMSADSAEAYLAAGEDLAVTVLDTAFEGDGSIAQQAVADAQKAALHTLIVVLLYETPSAEFKTWLAELDQAAQDETTERSQLHLLPVTVRERTWSGATQALDYSTLGEYVLRPVYVAAHVLVQAWKSLGSVDEFIRIF